MWLIRERILEGSELLTVKLYPFIMNSSVAIHENVPKEVEASASLELFFSSFFFFLEIPNSPQDGT